MELTRIEASQVDLTGLSTEHLREELANAIGLTAAVLSRLAAIWTELERRGEDLSSLRGGLFAYLPLIADGRLDPRVVVRGAGQAMLMQSMAMVPVETQADILDNGALLVDFKEDGSVVETRKPIEDLSAVEIRQLFVGGTIRTPAEQARVKPAGQQRGRRAVIVKISLTPEQYDDLRAAAAERGKRTPTLVRDLALEALESRQ